MGPFILIGINHAHEPRFKEKIKSKNINIYKYLNKKEKKEERNERKMGVLAESARRLRLAIEIRCNALD